LLYGVTKAAMLQLPRMLAISSLTPQVRVNSVPGTVRTEWHGAAIRSGEFEKLEQRDAARTPLAGYAEASDVADAIVGLLSMRQVTGRL
jgi:NAD(P)-dependent dehydrogenase (short-subunit alcohol dehydrogenase family)